MLEPFNRSVFWFLSPPLSVSPPHYFGTTLTTVFNSFNCKNELAEEENISIHSRDNEQDRKSEFLKITILQNVKLDGK